VDVLTALRSSPDPLSDAQLAEMLGREERAVSHECRGLAFRGLVIREQQGSGPILNKVSTGDF
jgi:predicted transcriptional regulator